MIVWLQIMSVSFCLSFLAALLLVQLANAHIHDELSEQYTYNVQLDNEGRYTGFHHAQDHALSETISSTSSILSILLATAIHV